MAIVMLSDSALAVEDLEYSTDGREIRFFREGGDTVETVDPISQVVIRFSVGGNWIHGNFRLASVVSRAGGHLYTYASVDPVAGSDLR